MSSIGGGTKGGGGGSNGSGGSKRNNPLDDWLGDPLDPNRKPESEQKKEIRNQRADARLPISFGKETTASSNTSNSTTAAERNSSSALERIKRGENIQIDYASNSYLQTMTQTSPSELIYRFTSTAHPRVQDAVKSTILGLIGTLPRLGTETDFKSKVVTSAERLASLMFQLQLTGYMFKNAEYRMAISKSIQKQSSSLLLSPAGAATGEDIDIEGKIKGKLKIKYNSTQTEMEVDADSYVSELRSEIKRLRDEITSTSAQEKKEKEQDLLAYIRNLPPTEMRELSNVSEDVLTAMKGLVNAVMAGIASGSKNEAGITPNTVIEQSGEAIAQLCMWQLVSGYNLRELEIREEMNQKLKIGGTDDEEFEPGLEPGGME